MTEDILSKASAEPGGEYIAELEKYNIPGEPYVYPALIDYRLTDSGMVEDTILHDDSIELCLTEQAADSKYRQCYDANWICRWVGSGARTLIKSRFPHLDICNISLDVASDRIL